MRTENCYMPGTMLSSLKALFHLILTTNPVSLCPFCGCGNWSFESFVCPTLVRGRAKSDAENFSPNTTGAKMSPEWRQGHSQEAGVSPGFLSVRTLSAAGTDWKGRERASAGKTGRLRVKRGTKARGRGRWVNTLRAPQMRVVISASSTITLWRRSYFVHFVVEEMGSGIWKDGPWVAEQGFKLDPAGSQSGSSLLCCEKRGVPTNRGQERP